MRYRYQLQSKMYDAETQTVELHWVYSEYTEKQGSANDNAVGFVGSELELRALLQELSAGS